MGRKNKYESHVKPRLDEIKDWYGTLTEAQIAKKLGISVCSFEKYKTQYPELVEALQSGKDILIEELKDTLKMKAKGFHYEETKTTIKTDGNGLPVKIIEKYKKYSAPDTGAIHLLLKNLDETWRNDDKASIDLKREKLELEKKKAESEAEEESW